VALLLKIEKVGVYVTETTVVEKKNRDKTRYPSMP